MSETRETLLAIFNDSHGLIEGAKAMIEDSNEDFEALSPIPLPKLDDVLPDRPSPVRWSALLGCIAGGVLGLGFQIATVLQWPLLVGGKPAVSLPAFVVVSFEMTILFGAAATLVGLFLNARLPAIWKEHYHDGCSRSEFALAVRCHPSDRESVATLLTNAGAREVRTIGTEAVWFRTG